MASHHDDLSLRYVINVPSGRPDDAEAPLVVCMHGRGADANDLADLAPMIDGPGGYRFVFPNAPRQFEAYPGMAFGWTWFDGWPAERTSFLESRKHLLQFLSEIVARYPTPPGKVVLSGFSQGGMMALDAGFRTEQEIAGIVVMSGALYEEEPLPDLSAKKSIPVLVLHGSQDDVIPVRAAHRTRHVLESHGIATEFHEFPMGHHVTQESMEVVRRFVVRVLG